MLINDQIRSPRIIQAHLSFSCVIAIFVVCASFVDLRVSLEIAGDLLVIVEMIINSPCSGSQGR